MGFLNTLGSPLLSAHVDTALGNEGGGLKDEINLSDP